VIKALESLKKDRQEMRNTIERMNAIVDKNKKEYLEELNKLKADHEGKINELNSRHTNDVNSLNGQINDLRQQIVGINGNLNSIFRTAGLYQVDDCGRNNVANPFTGGLGCPDGYRAVSYGRIKCPEGNGCGGNQFICLK